MLREQDIKIWEAAKPHLDVRNNDEHTLGAYRIGKRLLEIYPEANADVVLPTILLHDTGWKSVPQDKLMESFGVKKKYPELLIQHEKEGVKLTDKILTKLGYEKEMIEQVKTIIDGHDSTLEAKSLNDAVMKDADKLWRFTLHGNKTICNWYTITPLEVLDIIMGNSIMYLLLPESKKLAEDLIHLVRCREGLKAEHITAYEMKKEHKTV